MKTDSSVFAYKIGAGHVLNICLAWTKYKANTGNAKLENGSTPLARWLHIVTWPTAGY